MRLTFDGMYYKHQKGEHTVSLIAGAAASSHAFIQAITNDNSYYFAYPLSDYISGETVKIGDNSFSEDGIKVCINENDVSILGDIKYSALTPIRYDIMGPFKYLPLQCNHKVLSLHHNLEGSLTICDDTIDFTDGIGYIEGDFGTSFPESYAWLQCNDFPRKACIMVSVADIPFWGLHFRGCICIVYINGTEYRLATYLGVKVLVCNKNQIVLQQGKLRLEINISAATGHKLLAPEKGEMSRKIHEQIVCNAKFKFIKENNILFEQSSENASFEFVTSST